MTFILLLNIIAHITGGDNEGSEKIPLDRERIHLFLEDVLIIPNIRRKDRLMLRVLFFILLVCLFCSSGSGQDLMVSGQITSRITNEPLVAANIQVKGTQLGTTSDMNGNFRLTLANMQEATLVVTYVGYKRAEVTISESVSDLRIGLDQDILKTSEVVVTGFASSVKRENLANAVATISAKELIPSPAQTIEQALAGKFAGVEISQNTGAPGGGISVNLRGIRTIEGSTQPLYVVDGVILNNAATQSGIDLISRAAAAGSANPQGQPVNRIADLNPNDITSVEILKGASAAALYGSKAANGVILITTKSGVPGATRVDVNQQIGFNSLLRKIGTRRFPDTLEVFKKYGSAGVRLYQQSGGRFIDYEEEMYGQMGFINETGIGVGGGNDQTQFYASGLYRDEDGIVLNTGHNKYSGRLNVFHKFSEKVRVSTLLNFTQTESNRSITGNDNTNTTLGFSLAFTPSFLDVRPSGGVYPDHPFNPSNPFHTRDILVNREKVWRTTGAVGLTWHIISTQDHNLDFVGQGGVDFYLQENRVVSPPELQFERGASLPGASLLGETNALNTNLYLNLVHNFTATSDLSLQTTAGIQIENQDMNNVLNEARGLVVTQTNVDQAASINAFQTVTKQREFGFYVQEEVSIQDRYYLTGGLRGDASSANGDPDKFYLFPKVSGSVRLSQFDFWEPLMPSVSEFKVRVAYGQTGNLPPPDAKFTSLVPLNTGGRGGLVAGTRRGAPGIRPERTAETEAGFDATFLNENATLEFTYFKQNVSDLLLIHTLPPSSGFTDEFINGGAMETFGFEVSLGVTPFREEEFGWTSRVNFYQTESEITALSVPAFNKGGFATFLGTYRIETGLSPTTIIGAETNAGGKNIPLGNSTPDFIMSFNNLFRYGNFELGFLWEWKNGGDVINLGKLITDLGGTTDDYDQLGQFNIRSSDGLRDSIVTMKKGDGRLAVLGRETAPYIEDGSYWKLRELRLTYNVSQEFVQNVFGKHITYLRVGISGRNLLVFTKYKGYDPEVSQFGNVSIGRSVDTLPFPSSRSMYFHISFGL